MMLSRPNLILLLHVLLRAWYFSRLPVQFQSIGSSRSKTGVCEETGQNRQIMSCLYDHRCRILPPNSSDRSFSDAATVLEAAGMRRISSIWRPGSRNRVWALTAAWNLGISLL